MLEAAHVGPISGVDISPDGYRVAIGSASGSIGVRECSVRWTGLIEYLATLVDKLATLVFSYLASNQTHHSPHALYSFSLLCAKSTTLRNSC